MNQPDLPETHSEETTEPELQPTYAPATLALGIMFMFWGILTHWSMSLIGIMVMVGGIWAWMKEINSSWSETP
ncbi:hypothetical protein [Gimesia sp.]|uniref:hypothetical protein n=1 Tax=Gimesia sp. TaxID=2024833 RepID=UPI003A8E26F7